MCRYALRAYALFVMSRHVCCDYEGKVRRSAAIRFIHLFTILGMTYVRIVSQLRAVILLMDSPNTYAVILMQWSELRVI